MPEGVAVEVSGGVASIEFVDRSLRGRGVAALLAVGGPESVEKRTRPEVHYLTPESVAREAGLLDNPSPAPEPEPAPAAVVVLTGDGAGGGGGEAATATTITLPVPPVAPQEPGDTGTETNEGEPSLEWSRAALNEAAAKAGVENADKLANKAEVLDALSKAKSSTAP